MKNNQKSQKSLAGNLSVRPWWLVYVSYVAFLCIHDKYVVVASGQQTHLTTEPYLASGTCGIKGSNFSYKGQQASTCPRSSPPFCGILWLHGLRIQGLSHEFDSQCPKLAILNSLGILFFNILRLNHKNVFTQWNKAYYPYTMPCELYWGKSIQWYAWNQHFKKNPLKIF